MIKLKHRISKNKTDDHMRLNQYIAKSGVCSRREADQLIAAGLNTSKISKIISTFFNLSKREVYQLLIKNKQ